MIEALRHRDFGLFWAGSFAAQAGVWMQMFALGWLVVELAARDGQPQLAPLYIGLVGLANAVPALTLVLVAGAVADRVDLRRVLMTTQVTHALLALVLALLTASGRVTIVAVLAVAVASAAAQAFDHPTRQTMVFRIVGAEHVMSAVGLSSAALTLSQILDRHSAAC